MAPSDDSVTPAPPATAHADDRELGYGAADARPDVDGAAEPAPGKADGGESAGGSYDGARTPSDQGGEPEGQSLQGYSGGTNPNATSTRTGGHDRAG